MKTYYADLNKLDPAKIVTVALMPCSAKKFECNRPEMCASGFKDVYKRQANCLGMCDQGPAMLVNERIFTRVTPERVHGILAECRQMFGAHATTTPKERRI